MAGADGVLLEGLGAVTTICAFHSADEGVWIGADMQARSGDFIWPERLDKWVRAGRWRIGVAGNALTLQLLAAKSLALLEFRQPFDLGTAIMVMLVEAGYRNIRKDEESGAPNYGQDILLANPDGVWALGGDGMVTEPAWGFFAGGSGADYAYGAAHGLRHLELPADKLVQWSMEAAAAFDAATGGELVVQRVE